MMLATMPRHVVLRILYTLDRGDDDLNTLRAVGRVFALPQPCFPAARSLVVHTRLFGAEAEYRASVRRARPLWMRGWAGENAPNVNGIWEPTEERRRNRVVYRKRGWGDMWLSMTSDGWTVQDTERKEEDSDVGFLRSGSTALSPLDVPLRAWEIARGGGQWEHEAGARVEPCDIEKYLADGMIAPTKGASNSVTFEEHSWRH